jgi:hypothetical protein
MADFLFRLAFFAIAPFGIVIAAELFPVRGALLDVALALLVFVSSEAARRWAEEVKPLRLLLKEALAFEAHYRERPPKPFAYYVFYPLLFPYWLTNREARREFLVFRSYTLGSFLLLVGSLAVQYVTNWAPELGLSQYLPFVALSLAVETLLVLALLMPIATTVVWYHSSYRRGRLLVLLLVGLSCSAVALARVARRRDPIVSYATRERVRLRTQADRRAAHRVLVRAAAQAMSTIVHEPGMGIEGDGKVQGPPLDRAHAVLEDFYKHDEAYAFDVWASPRRAPRVLVVYFEARARKPPIWVALRRNGTEVHSPAELPRGAFKAMRHAAGDDGAAIWDLTDELEVERREPAAAQRAPHP